MIALVIIPILSILVMIYLSNLISFSFTNEMNTILTLSSILGIILLTLILPNSLEKLFKNSCLIRELTNKANILCGYVSFVLLFLFGVSLLINSSLMNFSILKISVGISSIMLFIYVNYYIFARKEINVRVISCDLDEKIYTISLIDDNGLLYEVMLNNALELDKQYKVVVLKNIKTIIKIKA